MPRPANARKKSPGTTVLSENAPYGRFRNKKNPFLEKDFPHDNLLVLPGRGIVTKKYRYVPDCQQVTK